MFLGAVLLYSASAKVRDRAPFAQTIRELLNELGLDELRMRPRDLAVVFATIEMALGGLLLSGLEPSATTFATAALLTSFAFAGAIGARSEKSISCHCFGSSETGLGFATIMRAAVLALPLFLYYTAFQTRGSVWWPSSAPLASSAAGLTVAAIVFFIWLSNLGLVVESVRERRDLLGAISETDRQREVMSLLSAHTDGRNGR